MITITIGRELLEQALEALETVTDDYDDSAVGPEIDAIRAIRAALSAPVTAPEAWMTEESPPRTASDYTKSNMPSASAASFSIPLYRIAPATAPEQPAWHDAPTEVKQIAEALRQIGLTLVRTGDGYKVLKLGAITAQEDKP